MTRDDMIDNLRSKVCTVTFTKINGEERVMECTLMESAIPESKRPKDDDSGVQRTINVISAFDVRKADWRSFRVENVKEFVCQ